jgi:ATP adenylyltransferase
MEQCPFCDAKGRVLTENEHAFVLLSDPRKVPGHALVIPKRHVEQPWELTQEERRDIFELADAMTQKLIAAKLGDGVDMRQNYRPFMQKGKLSVRHIHFHLVPRTQDDYIYQVSEKYDTELFASLDPSEAKEITKILHEKREP